MKEIILGGGISGLSAAFYLSKLPLKDIKIYESTNRVGGWIKSIKNENGTIFEQGPRTVHSKRGSAANTLEIVKELGLLPSVKPVLRNNPISRNRLIYFDKKLFTAPNKLSALFKISPPFVRPLIFGVLKDLRTPKVTLEDDTIHNFVTRRFGEDYAENILSALTCGVFGGDAKEISVKTILNGPFQNEQEYGSVIRGEVLSLLKKKKKKPTNSEIENLIKNWIVWTFESGLEILPIKIQAYLEQQKNVEILLEKKCTKVVFEKDRVLLMINGNVETAQHLYSSLPSYELAKILGDEYSFLKNELLSIPFVSIAIVNLEYKGDLIVKKAFGLLVPPNQNLPILGIAFDTCIMPQKGKTVLTVLMGGKWFEKYFGLNPDKNSLLKVAKDHVKLILKIDEEPIHNIVAILKDCIPQYVVGHSKRVQGIREHIKKNNLPLTLIGHSFDGVGINDSILSAKSNVESAILTSNLNALRNLTFGNH